MLTALVSVTSVSVSDMRVFEKMIFKTSSIHHFTGKNHFFIPFFVSKFNTLYGDNSDIEITFSNILLEWRVLRKTF